MTGIRFGKRSLVLVATFVLMVGGVVVGLAGPADATTRVTFNGLQHASPYGSAQRSSVASNGSQMLVVWEEKVNGTYGIFGRITPVDGSSIGTRLTIAYTVGHDSTFSDVAWNGQWLVVYKYTFSDADHDIKGVMVSQQGVVGSTIPIETSSVDQRNPAVSFAFGGFVVAYETGRVADATQTDIWWARVASSGAVSDKTRASIDTPDDPSSDANPDIVYTTNGFDSVIFVWDAQSSTSSSIIVDGTGDFVGPVTVLSQVWYRRLSAPAIAMCDSSGPEFGIAFENVDQSGDQSADIWFYDPFENHQKPFALSTQKGAEREPAIACEGRQFLVAWRDRRRDVAGDLYGAVVRDGAIADPKGFLISDATPEDARPALTPGTGAEGSFGVAWDEAPANSGPGVLVAGISVAPK